MRNTLFAAALALGGAACGNRCDQSVAEYCARETCPASPAQASALCLGSYRVLEQRCGGFTVVGQAGVDTGTNFYFDPDSGALVATVEWNANQGGSMHCSAGPGSFDPPDCPSTPPQQLDCDGGG